MQRLTAANHVTSMHWSPQADLGYGTIRVALNSAVTCSAERSLYGTRSALVEGDLGAEPAAFTCCATRSRSAPPRHDYASPAGHASPSSAAECARPATMPPFARDATVRLVGRDNAVGEWV